MEELIIWCIIGAAILLIVVPLLLRFCMPGLYYALGMLALTIFVVLDQLFSASFFPRFPWIMWVVWGAVIGAALGFWTVAPIYGLRHRRPYIAASPLFLMVIVLLIRLAAGR